jgi:hypothetical protein
MKKLVVTIAIVLGMGMSAMAQTDGGLFGRGLEEEAFSTDWNYQTLRGSGLLLPDSHGLSNDFNATPLGSGIALLLGLGGAYLVAKKRKEE